MRMDTSADEELVYNYILQQYNGSISRYLLEGYILYDLGRSPVRCYNILMNLVLKEKLFLVKGSDGEYYSTQSEEPYV